MSHSQQVTDSLTGILENDYYDKAGRTVLK